MAQDTPMGTGTGSGLGSTGGRIGSAPGVGTASEVCPTCGRSSDQNGMEQFLSRIGISDEMVKNLKTSMQNVDVEQYLDTAREYLSNGSTKATSYAKENPGKVAAGVAVLAVGAGLLISSLNRE